MEFSFIAWSVIGVVVFASFAVNAVMKVMSFNKQISHIFINDDTVYAVGCDQEAPSGSVSIEHIEYNHQVAA